MSERAARTAAGGEPEPDQGVARGLNHFAGYGFTARYWDLPGEERGKVLSAWLRRMQGTAARVRLYQVFPAGANSDLIVWSALPAPDPGDPGAFFASHAGATVPHRRFVEPRSVLWGFSGGSVYSRARSAQEIDPLLPDRGRYLVAYPFAKTTEWYLLSPEARQGMMNEHIRIGKQFPEIRQLLLYSSGLQDHEFVVVYEMDDLMQFSDLVRQLRATEVRRYTLRDSPVCAAVHRTLEEILSLWGSA